MGVAKTNSLQEVLSLCNLTKDEIIREYKGRKGFSDGEPYGQGLILDCAGLVSLLLLKNGIEDDLKLTSEDINIIKKSFQIVMQYVKENGYDATPFQSAEKTKEWFKPSKEYYYYDSVSWVLSLTVQIWNANKLENGKLLTSEEKEQVKSTMKQLLTVVCDGAVEKGGWGFTNNCDKADLYFSYTISESLADLADYILGESLDEGIGSKDDEIISFLTPALVERTNECRKKTSRWLVDTYIKTPGKRLGEVLLNPNDPDGRQFQELEKSDNVFLLLYYTYFVIDMLIINKADEFFEKEKEEITRAIEHGIYLTRIYFDKARMTKKEADGGWWESKASQLNIDFQHHPNISKSKNISDDRIKEPGLVPLSLRCNILYSFYISKGQDKKVDELYQILLEEKRDPGNKPELWDTLGYNLLVTERAIEGLIDYFDYIQKKNLDLVENKDLVQLASVSTSPVDQMLRSYINETVREYMRTEADKKPVAKNNNLPEKESITKAKIVDLLSELFTDLEWYNNPEKKKELDPATIELIQEFAKKYSDWLQNILYVELRRADSENDRDFSIYHNLKTQSSMFKIIAAQLKGNTDSQKFYNIILNTIEKSLSS